MQSSKKIYFRDLTWNFIGHNRGSAGQVARHLLVANHMTALGHSIVDHIERVRDIGHADHSQAHKVRLLYHHFFKDRLRTEREEQIQ